MRRVAPPVLACPVQFLLVDAHCVAKHGRSAAAMAAIRQAIRRLQGATNVLDQTLGAHDS